MENEIGKTYIANYIYEMHPDGTSSSEVSGQNVKVVLEADYLAAEDARAFMMEVASSDNQRLRSLLRAALLPSSDEAKKLSEHIKSALAPLATDLRIEELEQKRALLHVLLSGVVDMLEVMWAPEFSDSLGHNMKMPCRSDDGTPTEFLNLILRARKALEETK